MQTIDAALTRAALTDAHAAYRTQTIELLGAALAPRWPARAVPHRAESNSKGTAARRCSTTRDASRTIGWLTSHYPVTLPVAATASDTLCAVRTRCAPCRTGASASVCSRTTAMRRRVRRWPPCRVRVTFNYLGQFDAPRDATLVPRFGGTGVERDPQAARQYRSIRAYLDTDRDGARTLKVHWVYGAPQFERATIDAFAERFAARCAFRRRVRARVAHRGGGATPGDFARAGRRSHAGRDRAHAARLAHDRRRHPLSPMQQGILFHALFAPGHATAAVIVAHAAALDADRFTAAFDASIARHDILRTSVMPDEAAPLQCVHRHAQMPVEQLDWRTRGDTFDADFDAWLAADRAQRLTGASRR